MPKCENRSEGKFTRNKFRLIETLNTSHGGQVEVEEFAVGTGDEIAGISDVVCTLALEPLLARR